MEHATPSSAVLTHARGGRARNGTFWEPAFGPFASFSKNRTERSLSDLVEHDTRLRPRTAPQAAGTVRTRPPYLLWVWPPPTPQARCGPGHPAVSCSRGWPHREQEVPPSPARFPGWAPFFNTLRAQPGALACRSDAELTSRPQGSGRTFPESCTGVGGMSRGLRMAHQGLIATWNLTNK